MTRPIGIIGAMAVEVEKLLASMKETGAEQYSGLTFHIGELEGVPCVVVQCGAGKVNSAVCAQTLILKYEPRLIINIGVAGGVGKQVKIGDLVVGTSCVQYDFDTTAMGDPLGTLFFPRENGETEALRDIPCDERASRILKAVADDIYGGAHSGVIVTGDTFVSSSEKSRVLGRDFSALATEMEGGSIAQVCYMNETPCAVLRAISDNADDTADVDFPTFAASAAEKSEELLRRAVCKL